MYIYLELSFLLPMSFQSYHFTSETLTQIGKMLEMHVISLLSLYQHLLLKRYPECLVDRPATLLFQVRCTILM